MVNEIDTQIGNRIRQARLSKEMSQKSLAIRLGLSSQQMQKYEDGSNGIRVSHLWAVCNVLDLPVSFFFKGLPGVVYAGKDPTLMMDNPMNRHTIQLARTLASIEDEYVEIELLGLIKSYERSH